MRAWKSLLFFAFVWLSSLGTSVSLAHCPSSVTGLEIATPFNELSALALSHDCRFIFAAGRQSSEAVLYEFGSAREYRRFHLPDGGDFLSAQFSPDGRFLLSVSGPDTAGANEVSLWDISRGRWSLRLTRTDGRFASFDSTGKSVLVADGTTLKFYDIKTAKMVRELVGHTTEIVSAAVSRDGHSVLTGGRDGSVRLWDLTSGKLRHIFPMQSAPVSAVDFTRDGTLLLTLGARLRLWDVRTFRLRRELEPTANAPHSAAFSGQGTRYLLGVAGGRVTVYETRSGDGVWMAGVSGLAQAIFSDDGRWIVGGAEPGTVVRWRVPR